MLLQICICNSNLISKEEMSKSELLSNLAKIKQKKNFLSDTNYINYLEDLSSLYEFENIDSSMLFANELLHSAELKKSELNKMRALYLLGNINQTMNQNQIALNYYFQSYKIANGIRNFRYCIKNTRTIAFSLQYLGNFAESLKYHTYSLKYAILYKDKKLLAESYNNVGIAYDFLGESKKALENQYKALTIFDKIKNQKSKAYCYNNIGLVYSKVGEYQVALDALFTALDLRIKYDNINTLPNVYGNIGLVYSKMGQKEKALEFYYKCLEIQKLTKHFQSLNITFLNIADVYVELKNYNKAKLYIDSAMYLNQKSEDKYGEILIRQSQTKLYLESKDYKSAIIFGELAQKFAFKYNFKEFIPEITLLLYKAYKQINDNKNALKYHEIYKSSSDSILNNDKNKELIKLQTQFEFEQEKTKLEHIQNRKSIFVQKEIEKQRMIITGIAIAFIVIFILLISIVKSKNKIKHINEELILTNKKMEHQNIEIQAQNTEIVRQSEELMHLNDLKDKFVSIVSHDLRSPFVAFLGISETMATSSEYFSKDELVDKSKQLYESSKNMYKLLENLLELSIVHRGLKNFEGAIYSLNTIINLNKDFQAYPAIKKNITIEANLGNEFEVYADANLLNSIFRNLLTNAIKFTPQNGKINIYVEEYENDQLLICVEDSGVGIPPKSLENLFRLDKKVSTLGTEGEMSTGLGLIICKEYIDKHNGKIWVESEVGKGSKFFFTLNKSEDKSNI